MNFNICISTKFGRIIACRNYLPKNFALRFEEEKEKNKITIWKKNKTCKPENPWNSLVDGAIFSSLSPLVANFPHRMRIYWNFYSD